MSPPYSAIYSRAGGAFSLPSATAVNTGNSLRYPMGISISPSSPTQRFAPALTKSGSPPSPPKIVTSHGRTRSQTSSEALDPRSRPAPEYFDDRLPVTEPPSFQGASNPHSLASPGSSYLTASDLGGRSPTSPMPSSSTSSGNGSSSSTGYASAGSFPGGLALGRVPSLPLSNSYEQAQKRMNSGSWGSKNSWGLGGFRSGGSLSGPSGRPGPVPNPSSEVADEGGGGGMGGLLRRLSIGGASHPRAVHRHSISSIGDLNGFSPGEGASSHGPYQSPASPPQAPPSPNNITGMPGMATSTIPEDKAVPAVQRRGRQASVSNGTKRKPSPMGERLLMGHFNAH
ncbi:hypothetical protein IE53DRAFT_65657 [Violaceomyces palustris]|uniref:Uncharacterized protein n=1 Tax=Violaceomyces palustris TaxID=1673888 RepID=A0ACD0NZ71_9BASI|nr:hypothetical protein IE53DRAFT_65657 [Violaceomyces palustris]